MYKAGRSIGGTAVGRTDGRLGSAQLDLAWLGSARLGSAQLNSARFGSAQLGLTWLCSARPGPARLGSAWLGLALLGSARLGSWRAQLCKLSCVFGNLHFSGKCAKSSFLQHLGQESIHFCARKLDCLRIAKLMSLNAKERMAPGTCCTKVCQIDSFFIFLDSWKAQVSKTLKKECF